MARPRKRKQTPEENARQRAAIEARQEAVRWLISEHQEAFDKRHGDERVKRKLPREVGAQRASVNDIKRQLEAAVRRAELLQKRLEDAGG